MRKKLHLFLLILLLASVEVTFGKNSNNKSYNKKQNDFKNKSNIRAKRALYNDDENPFWPTRGKKPSIPNPIYDSRYIDELDVNGKSSKSTKTEREPPFWGTRGRRDSSSSEHVENDDAIVPTDIKYFDRKCKHCYKSKQKFNDNDYDYSKEAQDDFNSVWGDREHKKYTELQEGKYYSSEPSWKSRRQDSDPFWGARGRRQEDEPFWGQRGRREDTPFWGNRGRRFDSPIWDSRSRRNEEVEPFWGNRGRRNDEMESVWKNHGRIQEKEQFWANRGRRQDSEPFWGNRGRRQESDPFWGNRGRRFEPFHGKQKEALKETLNEAINTVENNIENLARFRRQDSKYSNSFWLNRRRNSQLIELFKNRRQQLYGLGRSSEVDINVKPSESSTVLDDRIYAEEPHYILVERSSRSSAEDDPFFISRGKKKFINYELVKAARGRRGAIEEIVKSVRNDPYYIARGKKDTDIIKAGNLTFAREELRKAKNLICSTIDLVMIKNESYKTKREINDNERDRRTTLKKLAAQLQIDPYFVSRGKKSDELTVNDEALEDFIVEVSEKCNNR